MAFKNLDPLLHSQLRLAIMSLLISNEKLDFKEIQKKTESTAGNLSVQINKLKEAGYVSIKKQFKNNYPLTTCTITKSGIDAFESYVRSLQDYLKLDKNQ